MWLVNKTVTSIKDDIYLKHILTASCNLSDNKQFTDTKSQIQAFDSRIMQSVVDIRSARIGDPEEGLVGMRLKT